MSHESGLWLSPGWVVANIHFFCWACLSMWLQCCVLLFSTCMLRSSDSCWVGGIRVSSSSSLCFKAWCTAVLGDRRLLICWLTCWWACSLYLQVIWWGVQWYWWGSWFGWLWLKFLSFWCCHCCKDWQLVSPAVCCRRWRRWQSVQ